MEMCHPSAKEQPGCYRRLHCFTYNGANRVSYSILYNPNIILLLFASWRSHCSHFISGPWWDLNYTSRKNLLLQMMKIVGGKKWSFRFSINDSQNLDTGRWNSKSLVCSEMLNNFLSPTGAFFRGYRVYEWGIKKRKSLLKLAHDWTGK